VQLQYNGATGLRMETKNCSLSGVKILVVDDEPVALAITRLMLIHHNAEVFTAPNATEGLEQIQRHRPDIIVSDIGMPYMNGYQFIREVRKLSAPLGGNTPAVALSAFGLAQDDARAIDAGFQRRLSKPIDMQVLVDTLASVTA
jgi:CheY-like chemotaxis protein